jgi:hypothetical protein
VSNARLVYGRIRKELVTLIFIRIEVFVFEVCEFKSLSNVSRSIRNDHRLTAEVCVDQEFPDKVKGLAKPPEGADSERDC